MRDRTHVDDVIVHVRGHVSAAEHVYAHDRVAQLRRLAADRPFRSTVSIVADRAQRTGVSASAQIHVDGWQAHAHAEGTTISVAVDRLQDRLRECIEGFGIDERDGSS